MTTTIIQPGSATGVDTSIAFSAPDDASHADTPILTIITNHTKAEEHLHPLIQFDVTGLGMPQAGVTAYLDLMLTGTSAGGFTAVCRKCTRNITEAATWNKYDGTNAWTSAGGDYDTDTQVTFAVPALSGSGLEQTPVRLNVSSMFYPSALPVAMTKINFLLMALDDTVGDFDTDLHSCESATATSRPKLTIVTNSGKLLLLMD